MEEDQQVNNPGTGSENEIADYYEGVKKLELEGYQAGIKKAKYALFLTGILIFISEMITVGASPAGFTPLIIGIAAVEAGVFIALGLWTKTKPYSAIIVGLILIILLWILAIAVIGGTAAYSGIIVRILIITYLVRGLKPAKAWEQTRKNG